MSVFASYLSSAARVGGAVAALLSVAPAWAGSIQLSLEEPASSTTYNGIANVRGFAFSTTDMRSVKLYVDGTYHSNLPLGGLRQDVANAFPGNSRAASSGFSSAFGYSNLTAGNHTFKLRAEDADGAVVEKSATFRVVRFDSSYIADPSKMSLTGANASISGNSLVLNNVVADGKTYNVKLDWRSAIQGYTFSEITKVGGSTSTACAETKRLLGSWTFTYTIISEFTQKYRFVDVKETDDTLVPCLVFGYDDFGFYDAAGGYSPATQKWVVVDLIGTFPDRSYTFTFVNSSKVQGFYARQYGDGSLGTPYPMTGVKTSSSAAAALAADNDAALADFATEADDRRASQEEEDIMDALRAKRGAKAKVDVGGDDEDRELALRVYKLLGLP